MTDTPSSPTAALFSSPFARIADVREGSVLWTDRGFTCLRDGACRTVLKDAAGELYIECDEGYHGLDGQEDASGSYLSGLYPSREIWLSETDRIALAA